MEFLRTHQLSIMPFLSGICGILAILVMLTRSLPRMRRRVLALMYFSGMFLMVADRYAYLFRGDPSELGYWMVRVSNFLVYFLTLYITHSLTLYLFDLFRNEGKMTRPLKRLVVCEALFTLGVVLLIVSQFTGLYYTFDDQNMYRREPTFFICYIVPLLIMLMQMSLVIQYRGLFGRFISLSLLLSSAIPIIASIVQVFAYGLSLTNFAIVVPIIILYVFVIRDLTDRVEKATRLEIDLYKEGQRREHDLFEQTTEALATAIDAKDKYTHGHSSRVAAYSQQIAREAGKTDEECEKVYFAGLLHDVGKIGISDSIINKNGRLTDEEFAQIRLHPVYGGQILSRIQQSPYLSIGAHFHHERYDGKGYPDRLKGEDIPEIARIIGVADAYDAMTSRRSYRDPIPQDKVREELVKGMGTQFDPKFAKIMLHLIDRDTEYTMQERESGADLSLQNNLNCDQLYDRCTTGICIIDKWTRIRLYSKSAAGYEETGMPSLILFDSLDGRFHDTEAKKKDLLYMEYGRIRMDGETVCESARKMVTQILPRDAASAGETGGDVPGRVVRYDIDAVRMEDHMMIRISDEHQTIQTIIALPDSTHFSYISITGEHCVIRNIHAEQEEEQVAPDCIPRIAEEISYIRGCPEGDIPNVQVNRWRSAATRGIPVSGEMRISFHAMSLPTARLVWHCPFVTIYTSEDGEVGGPGFRELALVRLDGENWESDEYVENVLMVNPTAEFVGWNEWKAQFKKGVDCDVLLRQEGNHITVSTENLGMVIKCETIVRNEVKQVYAALTGDQCILTDIHIIVGKDRA